MAAQTDYDGPAHRCLAGQQKARLVQLAAMSGSGPTCFGIFADQAQARSAADRIADQIQTGTGFTADSWMTLNAELLSGLSILAVTWSRVAQDELFTAYTLNTVVPAPGFPPGLGPVNKETLPRISAV